MLVLQIVIFLIIAAALGFVIGWVVRGATLAAHPATEDQDWQTRLKRVEEERDRLREQVVALEKAEPEAPQAQPVRDTELEDRAARLQAELDRAREASAGQRAEVERLEARIAELEAQADRRPAERAAAAAAPATAADEGTPPPALAAPEGEPDDLKRISGIGPSIEKTLHELGIFHFRQIAAFTPANVAWVNQHLRFKGRIEREDWIGQAKTLAAGQSAGADRGQPEERPGT